MKVVLNKETILWIVGVLQPVSVVEISNYIKTVFKEAGEISNPELIHQFCVEATDSKYLIRVSRQPDLYSLTSWGNIQFTAAQRRSRDKARIYLLKDAQKNKISSSREPSSTELDGAAPS